MEQKWKDQLDRLAAANARAHRERLQRMTMEESLRAFERLVMELHGEFGIPPFPKTHPIGLIKYWKRT